MIITLTKHLGRWTYYEFKRSHGGSFVTSFKEIAYSELLGEYGYDTRVALVVKDKRRKRLLPATVGELMALRRLTK